MAGSSVGRLLKATLEVTTKGVGAARDEMRSLGAEIDKLGGKQVSAAGYGAQAKALKNLAAQAQGAQQAFALTRQEALTLNYTIGDVVASLSSGASPMTVLLQQGGQVRDGFGNLGNLLSKISAQFLRFAPQIAAIGAAISAISFIRIGESAAAAAEEVGNLANKAGLSAKAFQELQAAAAIKDVSGAALAASLNSLSTAALKSADSWKEFDDKVAASRDRWTGVIKDAKLAAEYTEKMGSSTRASGDAFRDLGINTRGFSGSADDTRRLILEVARAVENLDPSSRKAKMALLELEGIVGSEGMKVFQLGVQGIKKYSAAIDAVAPALTDEQIALGRKYEDSVRLYEAGNKRLKESLGAIFIPAAIAQQDFFGNLLQNSSKRLGGFRSDLEAASRTLVEFFAVISGQQSNFTSPFLAGIVDGVRLVRDALSSLTDYVGPVFETIKSYAADGLARIDDALSNAGGDLGSAFERIREVATEAVQSLKAVFAGTEINPRFVGVALGIVSAIKALQVAAGIATPIVAGLTTTILKLAVGTVVGPLMQVAGAITSIGTVVLQSGLAIARFAAGVFALSASAGAAAVLSPISSAIGAIGTAAGAAANGVRALAAALVGLTVRTIFSPAVIGVGAIAAAAAAVGLLVLNWDRVKVAVSLAGAAINSYLVVPLEVFGLKALAVFQAVVGVIQSIASVLSQAFGPVFAFLSAQLEGFPTKVLNAFVSQFTALAGIIKRLLNTVWSGLGDSFEAALNGIANTQNSYLKQFSKNFEGAKASWDKALSLSSAQEEADKALEEARRRFAEVSKLNGTFQEDQAARAKELWQNAVSTLKLDPNNLSASAFSELERVLGLTGEQAKVTTTAVKDLVRTSQEAAGQTATIRVVRGGEAQQVKVLKDGVEDLSRAIDGVPREKEIRIITPGGIQTVVKGVDDASAAIEKTQEAAGKPITLQIDNTQIDQTKTKIDEVVTKKAELVAPVPVAPIEAAASAPLTNANAAIDALKQKITEAATGAQTFAISAVTTVAAGITTATGSANAAIDSLIAAVNRAIQSVNQLASTIRSVPSIPGASGNGGSTGPGYASGGYVSGAGTGTSDSIAAWLSNGEFVVRAAAVRVPGVLNLLHRINGMRFSAPALAGRTGFANGGLVGLPSGIGSGGSSRTFNLVIDGKTFGGLSGQSDTISALEKYATLRQLSATSKRAPSRIG